MATTERKPRTRKPKESPIRLNLGCGSNRIEGFVGVDYAPSEAVDVPHDLTVFPWPWADSSVDEIQSHHLIEHIPMIEVPYPGFDRPIDALCAFMNEAWRILKPGAGILLRYPCASSDRAWWDPTHRRCLPHQTWEYFTTAWRELNQLTQYPIITNFEVVTRYHDGPATDFTGRNDETLRYAIEHYRNVMADTVVLLKKPEDAS